MSHDSNAGLEALLDDVCDRAKSPTDTAKVLDQIITRLVRLHHPKLFWGDRMLILDRSAEFLREPNFQLALTAADSSTGANQYQSPDGVSWRYNTLIWAARSCLALPGDYVECGVYRGDMAWMVTQNVNLARAGKTFFLYDTFSGFDPQQSSADDFPDNPAFFNFADNVYKDPAIELHVRKRFSAKSEVVITKGSVPKVLDVVCPSQIAFLHLDMNSPGPELAALKVLFDRVPPGGICIFDDYGWDLYRKQKWVIDEFMQERSQAILELPTGQGLLIKR